MNFQSAPLDLAVDVGCGSGQTALRIAPHFGKVRVVVVLVNAIYKKGRFL